MYNATSHQPSAYFILDSLIDDFCIFRKSGFVRSSTACNVRQIRSRAESCSILAHASFRLQELIPHTLAVSSNLIRGTHQYKTLRDLHSFASAQEKTVRALCPFPPLSQELVPHIQKYLASSTFREFHQIISLKHPLD